MGQYTGYNLATRRVPMSRNTSTTCCCLPTRLRDRSAWPGGFSDRGAHGADPVFPGLRPRGRLVDPHRRRDGSALGRSGAHGRHPGRDLGDPPHSAAHENYLQAERKPRLIFVLSLAKLLTMIALVFLAAARGPQAACVAVLLAFVLHAALCFLAVRWQGEGDIALAALRGAIPPFIAAALMAGTVEGAGSLLSSDWRSATLGRATGECAVGALAYMGYAWLVARPLDLRSRRSRQQLDSPQGGRWRGGATRRIGRRSIDLDPRGVPARRDEPSVAGHERSRQDLGQREVDRIVGRHSLAKLPDARAAAHREGTDGSGSRRGPSGPAGRARR